MLSFDSRRFGEDVTPLMGGFRLAPATFRVGVVPGCGRLPLGISPITRFDGWTLPASRRSLAACCPANGSADHNGNLTPDAPLFVRGSAYSAAAQVGCALASEQVGIGGDGQFVGAIGKTVRSAVYQHDQSYERQAPCIWEGSDPPRHRRRA